MSLIFDAFSQYRDSYGLFQPHVGTSSGNGLLYTGEETIALRNCGEYRGDTLGGHEAFEQDRDRVLTAVRACESKDSSGKAIRGLWHRHPVAQYGDLEGPDDHMGVAAASRVMELPLASEWLDYGKGSVCLVPLSTLIGAVLSAIGLKGLGGFLDPKDTAKGIGPRFKMTYVFNNQIPGQWEPSAWFGRFPALIASMEYSANRKPPLWRRLYWAVAIVIAALAKPSDQDAHALAWCSIAAMDDQDWIGRFSVQIWLMTLSWKEPAGMAGIFKAYFGEDHPLSKYTLTEEKSYG